MPVQLLKLFAGLFYFHQMFLTPFLDNLDLHSLQSALLFGPRFMSNFIKLLM